MLCCFWRDRAASGWAWPGRFRLDAAGAYEQCYSADLYNTSNSLYRAVLPPLHRLAGTLGFGLARETEILCGVRKPDGSYETMSYTFGPKDMGWEKEVRENERRH